MPAIDSNKVSVGNRSPIMTNTVTTRLTALALALLVSTSLFAGIDHLAASEAAQPVWACSGVAAARA